MSKKKSLGFFGRDQAPLDTTDNVRDIRSIFSIANMAGSQLKRLKASLREQGVIGPQQSKKQRRKVAQNGKVNTNKRAAALESMREEFNPFDFKHNARGPKFQVTSNRPVLGDAAKGITGRPGDAKAIGEERVCDTISEG